MLDLFWFPVSYEVAIDQLAQLNKENKLDQKTIDFALKRICTTFKIESDVKVSIDIMNRTLELNELKT
jgi:hypothetical protein